MPFPITPVDGQRGTECAHGASGTAATLYRYYVQERCLDDHHTGWREVDVHLGAIEGLSLMLHRSERTQVRERAILRDAHLEADGRAPDVIEALAALTPPRPMRRGSVSVRRMRCNRSGCACATDAEACHGPYFSLTRSVAGTTRSRLLSAEQAGSARAQVEAGRRFRTQVEAYWRACERWADVELGAGAAEGVEKGGSRTPSTRRSSPR